MSFEYYFRMKGLHANDNGHERQVDGDWRPPRGQGKNTYKDWPGWSDYALFYHDSGATIRVSGTPESLQLKPYGTCSMYFNKANIWVVNCDATQRIIHDGNDNDTSDRSQASLPRNATNDWSHIHFKTVEADVDRPRTISYVTYDAAEEKLIYQHHGQEWAKKLFPDRYSQMGERSLGADPHSGGLVGDLPILLGLVALSVDPRGMQDRIPGIICGPPWKLPDNQERRVGWDAKRGVLVEVWTKDVEQQTVETVRQYEHGGFGKIFK
ncbi:hypothetical protein B0A48_00484 [Cryoendolithus antarcticus]|uniref:Uncharacterized protein n=1 Tax=Cryoendolithus antarcticus TaxID=1507870 RepID=A0A1V8TV94_9PEZI|nr:hypothetical protein B0A48_00484 [Cryoendolithus antarcticus]